MPTNRPSLTWGNLLRLLGRLGLVPAFAVAGAVAWFAIDRYVHASAMAKGTLVVLATFVATAAMVRAALIPGVTVRALPTTPVIFIGQMLTYGALLVLYLIVDGVLLPFAKFTVPQVLGFVKLADLAFAGVATLTVVAAAGVAFSRNVIYSAFALLFTLLGVGGLYIFLSAPFLAVTQLLIYVGGILVLILFAIMLTGGIGDDPKVTNLSVGLPAGAALGAAVAGMLVFVGVQGPWKAMPAPKFVETTADLGNAFLKEYLLPFEIASVLLLAALVGSVIIARKEIKEDES